MNLLTIVGSLIATSNRKIFGISPRIPNVEYLYDIIFNQVKNLVVIFYYKPFFSVFKFSAKIWKM